MRIFNKDTGKDGIPYKKVTSEAMCTELGPGKPHLHDLVKQYLKADDANASEAPEVPPKVDL